MGRCRRSRRRGRAGGAERDAGGSLSSPFMGRCRRSRRRGRAGRAERDADSPTPDLVDLGGNYEVVLGQAARDVGPEVDPKRAVGEVEVGVMGFSLGDRGDAVDELNPWHEALEPESASELEVAFDVRNAPTLQLVEQA